MFAVRVCGIEFFNLHLQVWEPGHEQGLRKSLTKYFSEGKYSEFEEGFHEVLRIMDRWWRELRDEVLLDLK